MGSSNMKGGKGFQETFRKLTSGGYAYLALETTLHLKINFQFVPL